MRIALAEIRRRRGRWASITGAVAFIVFLVLILAALSDGLFIGSTGALQSIEADALTYNADGRRSFIRSELPLDDLATVAGVAGVADAGALGVLLATAAIDDDLFDVAVVGHIPGRPGAPTTVGEGRRPLPGESFLGLADESLRTKGIGLGDSVTLTGSSQPVEVIGFVEDSQYLLAGTLWVTLETWEALRFEVRPETSGSGSVAQAFPIVVAEGTDVATVAGAVDAALGTETVTTDEAILSLPGVRQQASTFTAIIVVSFVVVGIVTALFFALVTLEKRGQLAILKAIGSSNALLLQGVLVQALFATVAGYAVGFGMSRLLALVLPAAVPLEFLPGAAWTLFLATIVMGALGASFSFRRIIHIDPASALGGEA